MELRCRICKDEFEVDEQDLKEITMALHGNEEAVCTKCNIGKLELI